jgi:hypothetical protein
VAAQRLPDPPAAPALLDLAADLLPDHLPNPPGHTHAVSARDAELLADPAEVDRRFLRIATGAMLTHEEHAPIPLPAGLYRVVQQREFDPGSFEAGWFRPVAD